MVYDIALPSHSYALPLLDEVLSRGLRVIELQPPEAYKALIEGRVRSALIPLALAQDVKICPGPMVWSLSATMSVAIYSRTARSLGECRGIAVSGESRTSLTYLLKVRERMEAGWDIVHAERSCVTLECLLSHSDCALILGDNALRARARLKPVEDLGSLVKRVLGVSPVYAVAASTGNCPEGLPRGEPPVRRRHIEEVCRRTGISLRDALLYFTLVNLHYDPEALEKVLPLFHS
ncbi:MqnA/MqnD/SBP family protein [Aeropyrum camini]|uniref:Predicted periplasmic solute-binding protein n=1 Tax=Aeropyrum camini SY1 = JCM 12091 TaxID=1198449 RepID=U3TB75_9CREN|nr:MqnA/MqnD/SBP family protein [Aeropyrum camini]BAN89661.1 predicted periplasmic solute-binding protein [Aeropyrum camini SY1 = JCM 12091]